MEPLSLAAVGAAVLSEGITFLYQQAGEALKRFWAREDEPAVIGTPPDGVIEGELAPTAADPAAVDRLHEQLESLWTALAPFAGGKPVDGAEVATLRAADALRNALEAIYGQRITFAGEAREPSGPVVEGQIDIDVVAGSGAGVIADVIEGGALVRGTAKVGEVRPGGTAAGVHVRRVGP